MPTNWDPWKKNYSLEDLVALAEIFNLKITRMQDVTVCFPWIMVQLLDDDSKETKITMVEDGSFLSDHELPGVPSIKVNRNGCEVHKIEI